MCRHYNFYAMKYFIRSVKYFFYFALMTTAIILVLVFIGAVEGDINAIFEGGYDAIWKIAIFFAVIAALYPKFGFINRQLNTAADWNTVRDTAIDYIKEKSFILESESADRVTFRRRSQMGRLAKMYEDRITLIRTDEGYFLEGLRKDVLIYASGIEHLCGLL